MQAAEKLRITAPELCKMQICDGIIPVINIVFSHIFNELVFLLVPFFFSFPTSRH